MTKTDLSLLLSAIGVLLAIGATPAIALTATVTYIIAKTLDQTRNQPSRGRRS